jgi:hypothetical protein
MRLSPSLAAEARRLLAAAAAAGERREQQQQQRRDHRGDEDGDEGVEQRRGVGEVRLEAAAAARAVDALPARPQFSAAPPLATGSCHMLDRYPVIT